MQRNRRDPTGDVNRRPDLLLRLDLLDLRLVADYYQTFDDPRVTGGLNTILKAETTIPRATNLIVANLD